MKKGKMISIRVNEQMLKIFDKIAEELGCSRSELIKGMMLNVVMTYLYNKRKIGDIWYLRARLGGLYDG